MSPTCWLRRRHFVCVAAAALAAVTSAPHPALAQYVTVYGGATYTPGVGGFKSLANLGGVNDAGVAVGSAQKI